MNSCPEVCPREEESQDSASPGVIADEELIARGAFHPSHGNVRTGNIRPTLIPRPHLFAGEGSVWRVSSQGVSLDYLVERLRASREDPLFAIVAVPAREIRDIRLGIDGPRAFSVVDECVCDADGGRHPAHGHVALCNFQKTAGMAVDSPEFIEAHRALNDTLRNNIIWTAPAQAA